jgi:hypothetical protein
VSAPTVIRCRPDCISPKLLVRLRIFDSACPVSALTVILYCKLRASSTGHPSLLFGFLFTPNVLPQQPRLFSLGKLIEVHVFEFGITEAITAKD